MESMLTTVTIKAYEDAKHKLSNTRLVAHKTCANMKTATRNDTYKKKCKPQKKKTDHPAYIQRTFTSPNTTHSPLRKETVHTQKVTVKLKLVIKHKLYEAVQNMHEHPHALTKMKHKS